MKIHAVPVVSQRGILTLPVLEEGDGPEGHEHAEEHCARVVKEVAHLKQDRAETEKRKKNVHCLNILFFRKKSIPDVYNK